MTLAICVTGGAANRIRIGFSMASFPDVASQDARSALDIWNQELNTRYRSYGEITTTLYPSAEAMAAELDRGGLDLLILATVDYLRLEDRLDADLGFLATRGSLGFDRFLLVARQETKGGGLQSLRGSRFTYVRQEEVGLLYLNHALLTQHAPEMDRFFASTKPVAKSSLALNSVYFGQADLCLVTESAYRTMTTMNPAFGRRTRIIQTSSQFPTSVSLFRRDYPMAMRNRIVEMVNALRTYPRGAQLLALFRVTGVQPGEKAMLAELRRIFRDYRQMKGRLL